MTDLFIEPGFIEPGFFEGDEESEAEPRQMSIRASVGATSVGASHSTSASYRASLSANEYTATASDDGGG